MKEEFKNYTEAILKSRVYEVAKVTPYEKAEKISGVLENEVFLKREDLQGVFSFKIRGAFNKVANLTEAERQKGIIAASAGNHAQGVALAAKYFNCPAHIFMPDTTPSIKVDAVRELGGTIHIAGSNYSEACDAAKVMQEKEGLTFVHAFDDPDVIAGQGTIGLEIIRQAKPLPEYIFVCVGGGGLIAGISVLLKQLYPEVKIIGVEHKGAPTFYNARENGAPVELDYVAGFADGAAVKKAGELNFKIVEECVDEFILVDTDSICASIKSVFEDTRTILEPAGALAVAGVFKYVKDNNLKGKNIGAITSGANINFTRLRDVAERSELGADKEAVFGISIPEEKGSFKKFCSVLESHNLTEFNYRYHDPKVARIFVGITINGQLDREKLISKFKKENFEVIDLTHDEIAKNHIRYACGGRNESVKDEKFFSFRFQERPGALMEFLEKIPKTWNISFFHYRNHGSVTGRVLTGFQIPEDELGNYLGVVKNLGYSYKEQTENPVCKLFL